MRELAVTLLALLLALLLAPLVLPVLTLGLVIVSVMVLRRPTIRRALRHVFHGNPANFSLQRTLALVTRARRHLEQLRYQDVAATWDTWDYFTLVDAQKALVRLGARGVLEALNTKGARAALEELDTLRGRAVTIAKAQEAEQTQRALARANHTFGFVELIVPKRIADEQIGDAREIAQDLVWADAPRRRIYLFVLTTIFWVSVNSARAYGRDVLKHMK